MSRYNIFKVIREVFREYKAFGSEEIATIKKQMEEQKQMLEKLKLARQERRRQEERLALAELRQAVEFLQQIDAGLKERERKLKQMMHEMELEARANMAAAIEKRVLDSIDLEKLLAGEVSLEEAARAAKPRGATPAAGATSGAPAVQGEQQQGGGGSGGGGAAGRPASRQPKGGIEPGS